MIDVQGGDGQVNDQKTRNRPGHEDDDDDDDDDFTEYDDDYENYDDGKCSDQMVRSMIRRPAKDLAMMMMMILLLTI